MKQRIAHLAFLAAWSIGAAAQSHNASDCREGSDFIRNAALARDNGTTREFFIGRLEEDFAAIRAFPPGLRWFVRNAGDEAFLHREAEAVFDAPESSDQHRAGFLARCIERAIRQADAQR